MALRPTCFRCADHVVPTPHTHNGDPVGAPCHRCGRLTTTVGVSGPGRPSTGSTIVKVNMPDDLLADLDRWADKEKVSRAEAVRRHLADALRR